MIEIVEEYVAKAREYVVSHPDDSDNVITSRYRAFLDAKLDLPSRIKMLFGFLYWVYATIPAMRNMSLLDKALVLASEILILSGYYFDVGLYPTTSISHLSLSEKADLWSFGFVYYLYGNREASNFDLHLTGYAYMSCSEGTNRTRPSTK